MQTKKKAILVDDEQLSIAVMQEYLLDFSDIDIVGKYTKSQLAVEAILSMKPDLLLLDIQMPGMNGFELLKAIEGKHQPHIIFITAFDQYAVQAFEVNAIGYLLKPLSKEKFNQAIRHYLQLSKPQQLLPIEQLLQFFQPNVGDHSYLTKIMIKDSKRVFYVAVDDVIYFEAAGDYVKLFCHTSTHLIHDTLSSLETSLSPSMFIRIHRSHLIQVNEVKEFIPYFNGEYHVVMKNGDKLKMSRHYKEQVSKVFKGL